MSLDLETLATLQNIMQNTENNSSEFEDESHSEFDEFDDDDDDEFDEFDDDDDDEFDDDDDEFSAFDDDDDEFIGRLIRRRKKRRQRKRDARLRAALKRVRPIRRPRKPSVARPQVNYAQAQELEALRRSANNRIKKLKNVTVANARANSALRRKVSAAQRKMAAAQKQQQMMAMMQMISPPQIEEIKTDSSESNTVTAETSAGANDGVITIGNPDVKFKTNPLALLPLLSSGSGGMNNMMLPLLMMTLKD